MQALLATIADAELAARELMAAAPVVPPATALVQAELVSIHDDGLLCVKLPGGGLEDVAWLETAGNAQLALEPGDRLLVSRNGDFGPSIALGRVGRYRPPAVEAHVTIAATESLTLKCGESSVDLRADGQLLVRGGDVTLRAQGTQRIRAAHVAIN